MSRRSVWIVGAALAGVVVLIAVVSLIDTLAPASLTPQEEIGAAWLKPPGTESAYAGSQECAACHAREFTAHAQSPHGRTVKELAAAEQRREFNLEQTVTDPVHGVLYSVRTGSDGSWLSGARGGQKTEAQPRWAFGSGTQAWTYLSPTPAGPDRRAFVEFRISYYPPAKEWTFTPGSGPQVPLPHPLGQHYTPLGAAACFGCHSTVLVGTRDRLDLEKSRLNVGCESCHGPSRKHVESARGLAGAGRPAANGAAPGAALVRPPRLTPAAVMEVCGACHRQPPNGGSAGPEIEGQLARFAGVALPRSRCFTRSGGRLSCITCHNPHERASREPLSYDRTCRSCHTEPQGLACAAGKTSLCVGCHMPEQRIARKLPLRFHNHWIRAQPSELERLELQGQAPAAALARRLYGALTGGLP